jgi:hypothetical protein
MHWLGIRLTKTRNDFVDLHGNVLTIDAVDDRPPPAGVDFSRLSVPAPPPNPPGDDYDDALPGA